ncbi:MAG: hypothetical protein HY983_04525 [Candidatus Magasanikbacteria bacterium]|nr:hypothetical protein [Candidatus Magasanikbacteria bacterium]
MNTSYFVLPHKRSPKALTALVLATTATGAKTIDMKDPNTIKAYGRIAAIEPAVAYLARKRGKVLATAADFETMLQEIRTGKLNCRERAGIAKIYDAHARIANLQAKGLEGITGENFRPSIALREAAGMSTWGDDNQQVNERFSEFKEVVEAYFATQKEFVN